MRFGHVGGFCTRAMFHPDSRDRPFEADALSSNFSTSRTRCSASRVESMVSRSRFDTRSINSDVSVLLRCSVGLRVMAGRLCGLQFELNLHPIVRKLDSTGFGSIQNSSSQQRGNVRMHCLNVSIDSPRGFPNRNRPGATQRFQQFPSLGGQDLPQQLRGGERDPGRGGVMITTPGIHESLRGVLCGRNLKNHGFHRARRLQ